MTLTRSLALLALGVLGASLLMSRRARPAPAPAYPVVRDAGPESMRLRPLGWDLTDETVDESFPASDPPGNY